MGCSSSKETNKIVPEIHVISPKQSIKVNTLLNDPQPPIQQTQIQKELAFIEKGISNLFINPLLFR